MEDSPSSSNGAVESLPLAPMDDEGTTLTSLAKCFSTYNKINQ
jgi:hypothetical protein